MDYDPNSFKCNRSIWPASLPNTESITKLRKVAQPVGLPFLWDLSAVPSEARRVACMSVGDAPCQLRPNKDGLGRDIMLLLTIAKDKTTSG